MLVTLSGIVTLVRLVQEWNAQSPMLMTPEPITTVLMLLQLLYHGGRELIDQFVMSPIPEMVSMVPSSVHVRLSPQVPEVAPTRGSVVSAGVGVAPSTAPSPRELSSASETEGVSSVGCITPSVCGSAAAPPLLEGGGQVII